MRIDKLLAHAGYGSRKEVKKLLKERAVHVNGEVVTDPKTNVDPNKQEIIIHGEQVLYKEHVYFMMNKPAGFLSATEDNVQKTVVDLLDPEDLRYNPFPVGRLDKDTEGLLLLTSDGQLAHQLTSPKKNVPKKYFAEVIGLVTEEDVERFKAGVKLDDGYVTKPALLEIIKADDISEVFVTITEGKYHQIKRMFSAVGKKVKYLKRIQMGTLELDQTLQTGEYRELTKEELEQLRSIQGQPGDSADFPL